MGLVILGVCFVMGIVIVESEIATSAFSLLAMTVPEVFRSNRRPKTGVK